MEARLLGRCASRNALLALRGHNIELHQIVGDTAAWAPLELVADLLAHVLESSLTRVSDGLGDAQRCSVATHLMPSVAQLLDQDPILHQRSINPSCGGDANVGGRVWAIAAALVRV